MIKDSTNGLHQTESAVAGPLDAAIQLSRARPTGPMAQPSPTQSADAIPEWKILFKGDPTLVQKGDKVVDDSGQHYIIEAPYWNSLGWNVTAREYHP